jgi:hypothetical protein
MGLIVVDISEAEHPNEAARGRERAMRAHRCRMFSFELQQRPNADADRKHPNDEPLKGDHA